jgi:SAM-dependent methyltransferase
MSGLPSGWLVSNAAWLPSRGLVLDVACGRGRNALWLAARGLEVVAVDRDVEALETVAAAAADRHLPVSTVVCDLEAGDPRLGVARFDAMVVTNYLHRPLFPALLAALRPGAVLIYETFTRQQAERGRPTNPAFLLEPGELRRLVHGLEVLAEREGEVEGRFIASIVARVSQGRARNDAS